jgi:peptidoglycan/LPS O-acetylase OafA/YrhL
MMSTSGAERSGSPVKKRFEVLDAFRGLAALCVVVYHLNLVDSHSELAFFRGSSVFVQLFFVLSGFVLAHGYGFREGLGFRSYMRARVFRIYPLHLFMFLVFVLLECGKLAAYRFAGITFNYLPFTGATAPREVLPNLLLIHAWVPFADTLSFNFPSWSISIEFYLYVMLFLSTCVPGLVKKGLWILIPVLTLWMLQDASPLLAREALWGLSCFFGGCAVYLVYRRLDRPIPAGHWATALELAFVAAIIWVVQSDFPLRGLVATLLFYATILVFAFEAGAVSRFLATRPFQAAGRLSYSIYLTHAAVIFCLTSAMIVLQRILQAPLAPMRDGVRYLSTGSGFLDDALALATLAVVLGVSSLTYRHVEMRGLALGRRQPPVRS